MNYLRSLAALLILLPSVSVAQTQPATSAFTKPVDLEPLIRQLSDNDFHTRESAENKIIDVGDAASTRIEQLAKETTDPEVRLRAGSILKSIATANYAKPSLVTLHY